MVWWRPYVVVFVTSTIDGKIASKTRFSSLSCPEDKRRQFWLRSQVDAVLVGVNTVIVDDPTLRPKEFPHTRPRYYRVVLDGRLRIPLNARILDVSQYPTIVVTSSRSDRSKISELRKRGVEVLEIDNEPPLPVHKVLQRLLDYGIRILMIEGGGETLWGFFRENIVDELRITFAPTVFGGREAVPLVGGEGYADTSEAPKLAPKLIGLCTCGREVHVIYRALSVCGVPIEKPELDTLRNFVLLLDVEHGLWKPLSPR